MINFAFNFNSILNLIILKYDDRRFVIYYIFIPEELSLKYNLIIENLMKWNKWA